nr:RNA-directed DNA polymerase, eukaryota [Tanacetum cinerariifolium]
MGALRSKKDDVQLISTSIFVTNFPKQFTAHDLLSTCNQYGNVIDAFIPNRRSKSGHIFGFIRFIKIKDIDRLVNNLCTIWAGRLRIQANISRFQISPMSKASIQSKPNVAKETLSGGVHMKAGDPSLSVFGKLKEFGSLANIKTLLASKGFDDTVIQYMGGIPLRFWTHNTFDRISSKWDSLLHVEDDDAPCFHRKRICIKTALDDTIFETFKIIVKGKIFWIRAKEVTGWTPDFNIEEDDFSDSDVESLQAKNNDNYNKDDSDIEEVPETIFKHDEQNSKDQIEEPNASKTVPVMKLNVNRDASVCSGNENRAGEPFLYQVLLGNLVFDFIVSPSVGNSGGILCVWDPNLFCKEHYTVSHYFIAVISKWVPNGKNFVIISAYAPKELSGRKMLWQYLNILIDSWKREVIVMGDFNEVCSLDEKFDHSLDKGEVSFDSLEERMRIMSKLADLEKIDSIELAQKAKIKWSIEGDENSKYFHSIINKLRNNIAIRGILVDGTWIEEPRIVKNEFFNHFKDQFNITSSDRLTLDMEFPNKFKGCNSSFTALILKSHDAKQVKDFRPISLIGSLYKIIAKLLANRLVPVMGNLVNEVQSAFIDNRQILDGPFILNEILQWCKAKKKKTMLFKVYFEKAFDSVRWDFLDDVLKKFGFGKRWCDWIQSSLRSSRGLILVNESPTSEFQFHKVNSGMFKGINFENSLHLSHLFYADDVVFIGQCKIMGIDVDSLIVDLAVSDIGCVTLKSPFSYLGVKIGGRMRCINSWEEIINKILSRLSRWKMKTLLIGGRLMLFKSVLGAMPIYYMSMFKVPKLVLKKIESIRSHFFKGLDLKDQKISLLKWENVLASKEKGGRGVSSLYALNRALIFKWIWRFHT